MTVTTYSMRDADRRSGYLLIELVISLTILSIGLLGYYFVFYSNFRGAERMQDLDKVRVSLENAAELVKGYPFREAYAKFHGSSIEAPDLAGPDGEVTSVRVTCYVNETAIPPEFGPIQDLDGDGVLETADCSTTYKLLPVRLSLAFMNSADDVEKRELFIVLGEQ